MTVETTVSDGRFKLPVINGGSHTGLDDSALEAELKAYEEAERERLGIKAERKQWVDTMLKPEMKREERDRVTILVSGLTVAQDFFVEGALRGLGYSVKNFGSASAAGLQVGKEFGNRGQCNPTYFTVGTLVKYLIDLRDIHGLSAEQIIRDYVFLTAGACGPCRFGMYVTEYRKALRDAGFEGFRVMLFQQTGGLSQASGDDVGLEMNPAFFIAIIKAIVCGDVVNALAYRIRPYETVAGAADKAIEESKRVIYEALFRRTNIFLALFKVRKLLAAVPVDKLKAKPRAAIIGEFWAMTTEGDGNYQLQRFLEQEGAENDIQLTTAWLLYNIWEVARDTRERRDLRTADGGQYGLDGFDGFDVATRLATMRLAEWGLRLGFKLFALPAGLVDYPLSDMDEVAEVAAPYYSNDLRGGEGHMEVGKLILNVVKQKAHLTVSVKPFGCMPSSGVSDGVQSLVTARFPGTLFCAVETSGDGATNFYSRVQMYLFKARAAAEAEFQRTLSECGVTEDQVRAFIKENPRFNSPLHKAPHRAAGSAADLVYEVAPYITLTRAQRATRRAKALAEHTAEAVRSAPAALRGALAKARDPEFRAMMHADLDLARDLVRGKLSQRFSVLSERLLHRALFDNDPVTQTTPVTVAA